MTRARMALLGVLGLVLATSPWWGRRALRSLAYFHVRSVQVIGTRYLSPRDVVTAMHVDTNASTCNKHTRRQCFFVRWPVKNPCNCPN